MQNTSPSVPTAPRERIFAAGFGLFLAVALLKFGNPAVLNHLVTRPEGLLEWLVFAWPLQYAYPLLGVAVLLGAMSLRWNRAIPVWLWGALGGWWAWQFVSATQTVDAKLTGGVLIHLSICSTCFALGALCLGGKQALPWFLGILGVGFIGTLASGIEQHLGGLKETRDYFWTYVYPVQPEVPPEYLKRMQSDRIFSTIFYPNAFAGAILLLSPVLLTWVWQAKARFTIGARSFLCAALALAAGACLIWTGSKGGWLLALLLVLLTLLHQPFPRRHKVALVLVVGLVGGIGFYAKYRSYFERGATSVVARFDYWRAAAMTVKEHPLVGSGPGTFSVSYAALKEPEAEMARLVHNDYLEQASDAGVPAAVAYLCFIIGLLALNYRGLDWRDHPLRCAGWLGVLAWALQSLFEFSLYVPSLAWTAFALAGWLTAGMETNRQIQSATPNLAPR